MRERDNHIIKFLDNELPIFGGHYYEDFEDKPRDLSYMLKFNVNDLQYRREVLKWYIDMNSGGTVHAKSEIQRVQKLLDEDIKKTKKKDELDREM